MRPSVRGEITENTTRWSYDWTMGKMQMMSAHFCSELKVFSTRGTQQSKSREQKASHSLKAITKKHSRLLKSALSNQGVSEFLLLEDEVYWGMLFFRTGSCFCGLSITKHAQVTNGGIHVAVSFILVQNVNIFSVTQYPSLCGSTSTKTCLYRSIIFSLILNLISQLPNMNSL